MENKLEQNYSERHLIHNRLKHYETAMRRSWGSETIYLIPSLRLSAAGIDSYITIIEEKHRSPIVEEIISLAKNLKQLYDEEYSFIMSHHPIPDNSTV